MPPKKRKASVHTAEDEVEKPMTKKEKAAAAKARAKAYGLANKERMERKKAEAAAGGAATPMPSTAPPPAKKKKLMTRTETRAKVAKEMTPKKPAAATASSAKKSPAQKTATPAKATTPQVQAPIAPAVSSPSMPGMGMGNPMGGGMHPMMGYPMAQQQPMSPQLQHMIYLQQLQQQAAFNQMVQGIQGGMTGYAGQMQSPTSVPVQPAAAAAPPVASKSPAKPKAKPRQRTAKPNKKSEKEVDDEFIPPPPPALAQQISQQVLENAAAAANGLPPTHVVPPAAAYAKNDEKDDESVQGPVDDQPIDMAEEEKVPLPSDEKCAKDVVAVAIFCAAIAFSIAIVAQLLTSGTDFHFGDLAATGASEGTPCFLDTNGGHPFDGDGQPIEGCDGVPCPTNGICAYGELSTCNKYFRPFKNSCVVNDQGQEVLNEVASKLALQSAHHETCDADIRPLFRYADLQKQYNTTLPLEGPYFIPLLQSKDFVTQASDGHLIVGLPLGHPSNKLPTYCHVQNFARRSLDKIGDALWSVASYGFAKLWSVGSAYPLYSLIAFFVVAQFVGLQFKRAMAAKLALDVANAREMAYGILVDTGSAHVVTHLRDEIARDLYPHSKKGRDHIIGKVWPRVVSDVKKDTRVKKSSKMTDGHLRDVWQWAAAPPSSGKNARFSDS